MGTSIEVKLRTAAIANPSLTALLGSGAAGDPFRWSDTQETQGSAFPAVTVQQISDVKDYSFTARLVTGWTRVQINIWGGKFAAGAQAAENVLNALLPFLDTFNAEGILGLVSYPTYVLNVRRGLFPQTDGPIYQRLLDVRIFNNDSI